jgi:hypothetical protein
MTHLRTLLTAVEIVLMTSAVHAVSPNDLPAVQCAPFLDTSRASFEACLKTYGASDEEAGLVATYLIQHQRALDRVMDKIGVGGRYLVYRPDGKLVDHVDPDALSAAEDKVRRRRPFYRRRMSRAPWMALCRKTPAKALITSCHRRSPETDHAPEADKNVEDSLKLLRLLLVVEEESAVQPTGLWFSGPTQLKCS